MEGMIRIHTNLIKSWIKKRPGLRRRINFILRLIAPFFDPFKLLSSPFKYCSYVMDMFRYSRLQGAEPIRVIDLYPCLHDKTKTSTVDSHYFYQDIWAFQKVLEHLSRYHVDVASRTIYVGMLSKITKVVSVDLRPLQARLSNLVSVKATTLQLPFKDDTVDSLSCLHVAEHIGLGRYGDRLDPGGTVKAATEFVRVLKPGGNLYFSLPVGQSRLCFNAHRIHSPRQILEFFKGLELVEFSGTDDFGVFRQRIDVALLEDCEYACGMFWFKKR